MKKTTTTNKAIHTAVQKLKQEHIRLSKELARVNEALAALGGLRASQSVSAAKSGNGTRPKRKVSAVARKRMAEAARARWAAYRKEKAKVSK